MTAVKLSHVLGCLAALGLAVGASGSAHPNARIGQTRPSAPLYSEIAAAHVADRLLARVPLPAKTERVAQPPSTAARPLGRPENIDSAKSVDRHAYWISTERPQALLAMLAADGPAPKIDYSGYGGTRGRTEEWSETLEAPVATPLAGPRELFVAIALAGLRRIDSVVVWHQRRPATSLVPAAAGWLEVTVVEPGFRGLRGEPSRPRRTRTLTTTTAHTVQAVARAVNELPLAEPAGPYPSCPAMGIANTVDRPKLSLTFRSTPAGSDLAQVVTGSGYVCARVGEATAKITTPEQPGLLLTDHLTSVVELNGASLADHIEAALDPLKLYSVNHTAAHSPP